MIDRTEEVPPSVSQRVVGFLTRRKRILKLVGLGAFAVIVGVLLLGVLKEKKGEAATLFVETLQKSYEDFLLSKDGTELLGLIEEAEKSYPGAYAHMQALNLQGKYFQSQKDWEGAQRAYQALADRFSETYLAPIALFNAATAAEEQGNSGEALGILTGFMEVYGENSPEAPEVLFNLGRLSEVQGDGDEARKWYNQLVADFSTSFWANIAKTRLFDLTIVDTL